MTAEPSLFLNRNLFRPARYLFIIVPIGQLLWREPPLGEQLRLAA
jgi:hypothetical protein